jgi:hypothetical protein
MFRKNYVGYHGNSTFVRGVWTVNDDGDRSVRVTAVGSIDDEISVGDVLSLEEIAIITEVDVFASANKLVFA